MISIVCQETKRYINKSQLLVIIMSNYWWHKIYSVDAELEAIYSTSC